MTINQVCHVRFEKKSIKELEFVFVLEMDAEAEFEEAEETEEKEGKLSGFISDKVLTNLLVDELIIIKKYIKIYYN